MTTNSIYSEIKEAETGDLIPLFIDGKPVDSLYSPQNEANKIINQIEKNYNFFIVTGLGSGILVLELLKKFKNCNILIIENSQEDYNFLQQIDLVNKLYKSNQIIFSTINQLKKDLQNNYIPALHGEYKLIEKQSWLLQIDKINLSKEFSAAINNIQNDFLTQQFFGKKWQSNIIKNLKENVKTTEKTKLLDNSTKKTAIVVAAGPSLDSKINYIKENQNEFYIISTDTAFQTLIKNNIKTDIVVSIDGQNISYNHYFSAQKTYNNTIFLFDLCSTSQTIKKLAKNETIIGFFSNSHPLCSLLQNKFPQINTTSGTVTITALEIALKLGFTNIQILGADFGFINGKSYAKGTYFDSLYNKKSNKIYNNETTFDKLLFRTKLIKEEHKKTTILLKNYEYYLENYLKSLKLSFNYKNYVYEITNNLKKTLTIQSFFTDFKYEDFKNNILQCKRDDLLISLLPYIAFLRKKNNNLLLEEYLNIAYKDLLRLI
jgi:hypothetical protein